MRGGGEHAQVGPHPVQRRGLDLLSAVRTWLYYPFTGALPENRFEGGFTNQGNLSPQSKKITRPMTPVEELDDAIAVVRRGLLHDQFDK